MTRRHKVSVVTPVFNGARYLAEAIESVLSQTYPHWEYVIVDNCSTDRTLALARHYAARDSRIRVVCTSPHLPIMQHWNRALGLIAPDTVYTKELHADDLLMPDCLAAMVDIMDHHPKVALVSSLILYGSTIQHLGAPPTAPVLDGHEVIRRTLLGKWYLFGSPSSFMVRTAAARRLGYRFYDERLRHSDVDACYRLLEHNDFGFIHKVLSATRTHPGSITSNFTVSFSTIALEHFCFLMHYGPRYFDEETFQREYRIARRHYRRQFARRFVGGGGKRYLRFHRRHLAQFGYELGANDALAGALSEIALSLIDARHAARSIRKLKTLTVDHLRGRVPRQAGRTGDPDMMSTHGSHELPSFSTNAAGHDTSPLER